VHLAVINDAGCPNDRIGGLDANRQGSGGSQQREEVLDIVGEERAGLVGKIGSWVEWPENGDLMEDKLLAGPGQGAITPPRGGEIHDHAPSAHGFDCLFGDEFRSRTSWRDGSEDDGVRMAGVVGKEELLAARGFCTTGSVAGFGHDIAADEGCPNALDNLAFRGAGVVDLDDGAEAMGRDRGLKADRVTPDNQEPGGWQGTGRENEERYRAVECGRREDGTAVAREATLGRGGVGQKAAAGARHEVEAESRLASFAPLAYVIQVIKGIEEADDRRHAAQQFDPACIV
jgi:hypothetical protein